jgi:hypothetical protein
MHGPPQGPPELDENVLLDEPGPFGMQIPFVSQVPPEQRDPGGALG